MLILWIVFFKKAEHENIYVLFECCVLADFMVYKERNMILPLSSARW